MKLLISTLLVSASLFAQNLTYKVKAPLFGTIGNVNINYTSTSTFYDIKASMKTFGFAKKLSGNRLEEYHSYGSVNRNIYKAKEFSQNATYKNKKVHLSYKFDYANKKIRKIRKKWKDGKIIQNKNQFLSYFTYNDLFSVYHNIIVQLKGKPAGSYQVKVAGVEKNGGNLLIKIPSLSQQKKEAKSLGVKDIWIFHIITHQKLMGSKNGEIIFAVGDDGIAKAVRVLNTAYVSHVDAYLVR